MMRTIELARKDVNAFIELVATKPGGGHVQQDPIHRAWQSQWSRNRKVVLLAPVGTGKSTQIIYRLIWEIGRNPNVLISIISATERHPKKLLRQVSEEIENNPRVRWVFPNLRPSSPWTTTEIQVERPVTDKDPTIQVFGLFGKILGSRSDIVIFDDLCNFENTLTDDSREKIASWIAEVISRLKPGARIWAIGHIWHEEDQLQRFAKKPGWAYDRYEAIVEDPETGEQTPLTPTIMSLDDISEKEIELGPTFAEMMLYNRLPAKNLGRFREQWFTQCLKLGRGLEFRDQWRGGPAFTGVDLGHRKQVGKDLTVMFTAALLPDGSRMVLDIRSGLWKGPEIRDNLVDIYGRYGSTIAVENNAAQQYILDFAEEGLDAIPVHPHTTGLNKWDMQNGVESLGRELARAGWILPCDDNLQPPSEMAKAIKACFNYMPDRHTPDHLMAWWICREAVRLSPIKQYMDHNPDAIDVLTR